MEVLVSFTLDHPKTLRDHLPVSIDMFLTVPMRLLVGVVRPIRTRLYKDSMTAPYAAPRPRHSARVVFGPIMV